MAKTLGGLPPNLRKGLPILDPDCRKTVFCGGGTWRSFEFAAYFEAAIRVRSQKCRKNVKRGKSKFHGGIYGF